MTHFTMSPNISAFPIETETTQLCLSSFSLCNPLINILFLWSQQTGEFVYESGLCSVKWAAPSLTGGRLPSNFLFTSWCDYLSLYPSSLSAVQTGSGGNRHLPPEWGAFSGDQRPFIGQLFLPPDVSFPLDFPQREDLVCHQTSDICFVLFPKVKNKMKSFRVQMQQSSAVTEKKTHFILVKT